MSFNLEYLIQTLQRQYGSELSPCSIVRALHQAVTQGDLDHLGVTAWALDSGVTTESLVGEQFRLTGDLLDKANLPHRRTASGHYYSPLAITKWDPKKRRFVINGVDHHFADPHLLATKLIEYSKGPPKKVERSLCTMIESLISNDNSPNRTILISQVEDVLVPLYGLSQDLQINTSLLLSKLASEDIKTAHGILRSNQPSGGKSSPHTRTYSTSKAAEQSAYSLQLLT
jgi:hypothetical protein